VSCQASRMDHVTVFLHVARPLPIGSAEHDALTKQGQSCFEPVGTFFFGSVGNQFCDAGSQPSWWHKRAPGAYCSSVRSCAGQTTHPIYLFIAFEYTYEDKSVYMTCYRSRHSIPQFFPFVNSRRSGNGLFLSLFTSFTSFLFFQHFLALASN
jgi:hypothetical protein